MDAVTQAFAVRLDRLIEEPRLAPLWRELSRIFDVPLRLFDDQGNLIVEVADWRPACRYFTTAEGGLRECTTTRLAVKNRQVRLPLEHHDCVTGLRYSLAPVRFQNEVIGKIVVGPYLPSERTHVSRSILQITPTLDPQEIKARLSQMKRLPEETVASLALILGHGLDALLQLAHQSQITSEMHLASVRESNRILAERTRQLEELREERREFERIKASFLSTVSHELRTPLTSIIGYSDMLGEGITGPLSEEQRKFVETIREKGYELLGLISSILDFSEVESGRTTLDLLLVDPTEIVATVLLKAEAAAQRRGITLTTEATGDLPRVNLDPGKIETAVSHLVDNAIKFSAPGSTVEIAVRSCEIDEADMPDDGFGLVLLSTPRMLEIAVQDRGIGMPPEEQSNVFKPFTQIDNTSTREHGGAGLGLTIVRHHVELHGGRVLIHSRVGEGTTVAIRIPIVASGGRNDA